MTFPSSPRSVRLLVPPIMGIGHLHINFSSHLQLNKVANTFPWKQSSDRFFVKSSVYATETHLIKLTGFTGLPWCEILISN